LLSETIRYNLYNSLKIIVWNRSSILMYFLEGIIKK